MLLGFRGFVAANELDHVVLPVPRRSLAFVADLVENVVEVTHGIDDLLDVGFLECGDVAVPERLNLEAQAVAVRIAIDAVDVIGGIEWVTLPRIVVCNAALGA